MIAKIQIVLLAVPSHQISSLSFRPHITLAVCTSAAPHHLDHIAGFGFGEGIFPMSLSRRRCLNVEQLPPYYS
jgi:hypothetical protein